MDTSAPVPNMDKTVPEFASTNARPNQILIPFDEFIKLNNPSNNITVTPELATKPKFEVRGRSLFITFESEELMDNTTYSFVFNKAIADVNEGNDTTFTFVFSTGPVIDSLLYSAVLIDVETQSPVSNASIGLYAPSDSLNPYKDRPKYIAQTDKEGLAKFAYLSEQELEVFAFFNPDGGKITKSSQIAFLSETITIDTNARQDTLYLFQPELIEDRGRIVKKDFALGGRITFVTNFEHQAEEIRIRKDNEGVETLMETTDRKDSTILWIKAQESSAYQVSVPFRDTVLTTRIPVRKIPEYDVKHTANLSSGELEIQDSLTLTFDLPIASLDTTKILVFESDSIPASFDVRVLHLRRLQFLPAENHSRVFIAPEALTFYNGLTNKDTIDIKFIRKGENKYANLELILENKPPHPLILRLHKGKDVALEKLIPLEDSILLFPRMQPGEYTLQFIVDLNENGIFDLGDFPTRRQPEPVIWFRQPITLRANWDSSQPVEFKK